MLVPSFKGKDENSKCLVTNIEKTSMSYTMHVGTTTSCQYKLRFIPIYNSAFSFHVCRLAESERRYHNRESRPEDLEVIRDLRVKLREQEQKMKELVVSGELAHDNNRLLHIYTLLSKDCESRL